MKTRDVGMLLSVDEAKARLEELLDAAAANPVQITAPGGRAAYLVRAELARKGGFVGSTATQEIIEQLEDGCVVQPWRGS